MDIKELVDNHFNNFNSRSVKEAAQAYRVHKDDNGIMLVTLGGAMSTAGIGSTLAPMIRQGLVDAVCTTGANLEEDVFKACSKPEEYLKVDWQNLGQEGEVFLRERQFCRVLDSCIPTHVMDTVRDALLPDWHRASLSARQDFPFEFFYHALKDNRLPIINATDSWVHAAYEMDIPVWTPGWEDSTLGNIAAAKILESELTELTFASGLQQMQDLIEWYETFCSSPMGMFQIGGGIAGDFPICVVPTLREDLKREVPRWKYFCQISDSTTSYGSYSGADPREKITWDKLEPGTPMFKIESDATIVAPLIFAYLLK